MESYLAYIFVLNIVLVLFDVSMGYHLAPLLGRKESADDEALEKTTRGMRKLLCAVVALYTFFNCLAYSKGSPVFLLVVSGIIVLDILGQYMVRRKLRNFVHH